MIINNEGVEDIAKTSYYLNHIPDVKIVTDANSEVAQYRQCIGCAMTNLHCSSEWEPIAS